MKKKVPSVKKGKAVVKKLAGKVKKQGSKKKGEKKGRKKSHSVFLKDGQEKKDKYP